MLSNIQKRRAAERAVQAEQEEAKKAARVKIHNRLFNKDEAREAIRCPQIIDTAKDELPKRKIILED